LALRIARLFHLIRGSASKAFKIGIGACCDDEQDTGKHCEAKSGLAERHRRASRLCGLHSITSSARKQEASHRRQDTEGMRLGIEATESDRRPILRCGPRALSRVGRGFKIHVAGERYGISEGQDLRGPIAAQFVFAVDPIEGIGKARPPDGPCRPPRRRVSSLTIKV
jgi:hypothetical protein